MRHISAVLGVTFVIALAVVGWTFFRRHEADQRLARRLEAERPAAGAPAETGGPGVKITQFYAQSGEVIGGERSLVCYGVRNAKSVRIDPPGENLAPSPSRCFPVEPKTSTKYTLVAEGFDGSRDSASFEVQVKAAPPHIEFVTVSQGEVRRGESVTVCYGVKHAKGVRLDPLRLALPPLEKNCTQFHPAATMNYSLVAFDADGRTDQEKFTIRVR